MSDESGHGGLRQQPRAGPAGGMEPLSFTVSNPPQAQVQLIVAKLDELIAVLQRS